MRVYKSTIFNHNRIFQPVLPTVPVLKYIVSAIVLTISVIFLIMSVTTRIDGKEFFDSKGRINVLKSRLLAQGLVKETNLKEIPIADRCPSPPPGLVGRKTVKEGMVEEEVEKNMTEVLLGGSWWPSDCVPAWRLAVIVPYRNREVMVGPFLNHMHPFLQRQLLNYTIFFVEQSPLKEFNRAKLLNIGYVLSQKYGPYDCYAFHDVDCIPENDHNLYYCPEQPRHLGIAMQMFNYKLVYGGFFGCACLMTGWQVEQVNGWSNKYFGWGGEDDNMWRRIHAEGMKIWRVADQIATYATLKHDRAKGNPDRLKILKTSEVDYKIDGLNSLDYNLTGTSRRKLYTKFLVDI